MSKIINNMLCLVKKENKTYVCITEEQYNECLELKTKYENTKRELISRTNKLTEITKENNELKEKFNKIKKFIKGDK